MNKRFHLSRLIIVPIWLVLILGLSLHGCKKDGGEEYDVEFILTPSQSPGEEVQILETYTFHCLDTSTPGCNTFSFQDVPHDSGNWMSYPQDGSACLNFVAVVNGSGGAVFTFIGTLVNPEKPGGIKAIGTYDKEVDGSTVEVGTFTATSEKISGDDSPLCN